MSADDKLVRIVALLSNELGKALAAAEEPATALVKRFCAPEQHMRLLQPAPQTDTPSTTSTDVGRQVRELVARVRRLETALRAVDDSGHTATDRVATLEREAAEHKTLFEHEHERLLALEKEHEQRRAQEKRDLFKLLSVTDQSSTTSTAPIVTPETFPQPPMSPATRAVRGNHVHGHHRYASVGGGPEGGLLSTAPPPELDQDEEDDDEEEGVEAAWSVQQRPKTLAELLTMTETLLDQVEEDRKTRSASPPPPSTTAVTAASPASAVRIPGLASPAASSPSHPARRRAGSVLETLFEPLKQQQSDTTTTTTTTAGSPLVECSPSPMASPVSSHKHGSRH